MSVTQASLLGDTFGSKASGTVPIGGIIMWSGTVASLPTGWSLCNGTGGTPDLRNRFIIGASGDESSQSVTAITGANTKTGGSKDAILVSHSHTATVSDPGHSHSISTNYSFMSGNRVTSSDGSYSNHTGGTNTSFTGISVSNSTEGSSATNANLPPYYALAFIMRVS